MPSKPSKTKHVFVFLEIFSQEGGIQSYVKNVLEAYCRLNEAADSPPYRAEVFLLRDAPMENNPYERDFLKFRYFRSPSAWLGRIKLTVALLQTLLQDRPQLVICGHIKLAVLIQTLCLPLGIPYTVSTHGKEVWYPLPGYDQAALQKARLIWTVSRYSRDRLCESNHVSPDKMRLLPCVVDGQTFTPAPKPAYLQERYQLGDAKVLMTVARLWSGDPYKGVDVTIRALPQIVAVFPHVKYLVIGRGDDKPRLEQLAKDLGMRDRVIFAGFVPDEELPDHYRVSDAYIMPSQEGFGIVYLEAMATGIPVLSGDSDGSADPLQDGRMGWQVPYRDVEAVAQNCIELLKGIDKGYKKCSPHWLRQETLAKFSKDALAKRLGGLLEEAVSK
ncbi:glycosyltransferase family 4 protein [Spirulina sp. CS-785/01]|uniref:glycosyltransferase family 4 protein n=1 Tax=Spirulina sp. CS-785/01 TaxID=3021716 RepID=UPI00232F79C5|nr:glycosyltransferase family 4 protein [Spirulina sp. CS-785/01]MDB9313668.1 glycosyltransferase family 4 protein [Spirulina sp. CS-785/01]